MDNPEWYAIAVAGISACAVCIYVLRKTIDVINTYITFYVLKRLVYNRVPKYLRLSGTTTWFDVVWIIIYLVGNALCLTIGITSRTQLLKRAGMLSTVNLMPLALGAHMNLLINQLGLGLEAYHRIHRWIARVTIVEGLLHVALALTSQAPNLHDSAQRAAIVVI
jgi:hypothetical protein